MSELMVGDVVVVVLGIFGFGMLFRLGWKFADLIMPEKSK